MANGTVIDSGTPVIRTLAKTQPADVSVYAPRLIQVTPTLNAIALAFDQQVISAPPVIIAPPPGGVTVTGATQASATEIDLGIIGAAPVHLDRIVPSVGQLELRLSNPISIVPPPTVDTGPHGSPIVTSVTSPDGGQTIDMALTAGSVQPTVTGVVAGPNTLAINWSDAIDLTAYGATTAAWSILGLPSVVVTAVTKTGAQQVTLTLNEPRTGVLYGLSVDVGAVVTGAVPNSVDSSQTFVGIGIPPTIANGRDISGTTILVTYSEPVQDNTALNVANYSIAPALQVLYVTKLNATQYLLTTAKQAPATIYTVTITGVLDLAGNPI